MKRLIAIFVLFLFVFYSAPALAQQDGISVDSLVTEQQTASEPMSFHKVVKQKFVEGSPFFMSFVALVLVVGLAVCIERIIFLNMSEINSKNLLSDVGDAISKGDMEMAKNVCHSTRGPVASICYEGLSRIDQGTDVVEKAVIAHGNVQAALLEKGCRWIKLFIVMAPVLGFLGTIIGMVQAFDKIQITGDISATIVAGGMKVALITTIFGLVAGLVLQIFYSYILSKIDNLTSDMENASLSLLDMVSKYNLKYKR
jgi:biopolymer transport protein ExbB